MKRRPLTLARIEVTQDDIEEMYDRYDSGMADHTTANAVCLALQRQLRPEIRPRIRCAARHHGCRLEFGSEFFSLPPEIFWWLDRTNNGRPVRPASFAVTLPEEFLLKNERAKEALETAIAA